MFELFAVSPPLFEYLTKTQITELRPAENCHGWSPAIPRIVPRQPKDGHQPEGSILKLGI